MTDCKSSNAQVHHAAEMYAEEHLAGHINRREFLTRATALGLSAAASYSLIGAEIPRAEAATMVPKAGGTLRVQMIVPATKDPRLWDSYEVANFCRGWLEYLVEYDNDGSFRGMLLDRWEVNEDATIYTLFLRKGVTWTNGNPFTAKDVVFNITRWCDSAVPGNSMASHMNSLVDPKTKKLREGGIVVKDDHTVELHLSQSDITVIAGMADYPAAIVDSNYDGSDPSLHPVGTGPFLPELNQTGVKQVLVKNTKHTWWGTDTAGWGGPWLDKIEFIDLGTNTAAYLAAAESNEIDMTLQTVGDYIKMFGQLPGWTGSEAVTANTLVVRWNEDTELYKDPTLRKAMQLAVSNKVVLDVGYNGRGTVGENHHVCPIHPEYYKLPPLEVDAKKAKEMLDQTGHADTEFELISLDDDWQAATCDNIAAQLRQAGFKMKRTIIPAATFWNDWDKYPFSGTEWFMRPLGVQVLLLAYRSGAVWNESHFADPSFDEQLDKAMSLANVDERRAVTRVLEEIMQDKGVIIQSYWRKLYNNYKNTVHGAEIHPMTEFHMYKWWMET
jgi:peptide/nickel transport system substrate-binding protein